MSGCPISRVLCEKCDPNQYSTIPRTWQRRFYDFNVWTEAKWIEKLRYIHRNPVTRGLVEQPEQWQWSSFCSYAFGDAGPVKVNDCGVPEMRVRPAG